MSVCAQLKWYICGPDVPRPGHGRQRDCGRADRSRQLLNCSQQMAASAKLPCLGFDGNIMQVNGLYWHPF